MDRCYNSNNNSSSNNNTNNNNNSNNFNINSNNNNNNSNNNNSNNNLLTYLVTYLLNTDAKFACGASQKLQLDEIAMQHVLWHNAIQNPHTLRTCGVLSECAGIWRGQRDQSLFTASAVYGGWPARRERHQMVMKWNNGNATTNRFRIQAPDNIELRTILHNRQDRFLTLVNNNTTTPTLPYAHANRRQVAGDKLYLSTTTPAGAIAALFQGFT